MTLYADLFRYPDLFLNLFRRELRVKYKGSLLGLAWTLVNPIVLMGVYTLIFSILLRAVSIHHFPLFVMLPVMATPGLEPAKQYKAGAKFYTSHWMRRIDRQL